MPIFTYGAGNSISIIIKEINRQPYYSVNRQIENDEMKRKEMHERNGIVEEGMGGVRAVRTAE